MKSAYRFLAIATLALAAPLGAQTVTWQPPRPAEYGVAIFKDMMMPARDGVRLATDVYLPARDGVLAPGKFPVLLARTPYDKNSFTADEAAFLAKRGYAVVVQDVRGRYGSEGTFYIYLNEGKDGYDAVEWAAKQGWSNGSVGTYGPSYLAGTQSALAAERPPSLKAMWIQVGTSNYHEDGWGRGGANALLHNLAYAFNLTSNSQEAAANPALKAALTWGFGGQGLAQWIQRYPFGPGGSPFEAVPAYQRWFQDWVDNNDYAAYWKQNGYSFEDKFDRYLDVPIYVAGGWYDIFLRGTLNTYTAFAGGHKSPTRMLVGPWQHGLGPRATGEAEYGPTAEVNLRDELLRWFDAVLQGRDNGILAEPPVRIFTMGGGSGTKTAAGQIEHGGGWKFASAWPLAEASALTFHLHSDGGLRPDLPAAGSRSSSFTYDPSNPVPTIGGQINSGDQLVAPGAFDQRCRKGHFGCGDELPLSARPDVLVFQTPPLEADVETTGPITVTLWVASSARDTDFTAKLVDVYPPSPDYPAGFAMNIADRIVRMRYSKSTEKAELLKPGEVREVKIDLLGTSNRFAKGHRIRLDIASSNFPFFDVNPNTGEAIGHHTQMVPAMNTVFHDRTRPSRLVLSVVSPTVRVTAQ